MRGAWCVRWRVRGGSLHTPGACARLRCLSVHATAVAFSAVEPSMPKCPQANDSPARLLMRIA